MNAVLYGNAARLASLALFLNKFSSKTSVPRDQFALLTHVDTAKPNRFDINFIYLKLLMNLKHLYIYIRIGRVVCVYLFILVKAAVFILM